MSVTGSFYGRERFDPILILAQIVLLQACFYTSYLLLLVFFNRATGTVDSVTDQVFDHTHITLKHFPGWVTTSALVLAAVGPTALAFVAIVGRAKRAADFACTLLISHVVATSIHSGFPNSLVWWAVHIVATVGLAVVAEFVSLRLELRDIAVPRDRERDRERDRDQKREDDIEAQVEETDPSRPSVADDDKPLVPAV